jgi:hypothetical protein
MSDPLEPSAPLRPRRPLGRWLILLVIWIVGLAVWIFYFLVIAWTVLKIF